MSKSLKPRAENEAKHTSVLLWLNTSEPMFTMSKDEYISAHDTGESQHYAVMFTPTTVLIDSIVMPVPGSMLDAQPRKS